jgi:hypothetical protein
MSVARVGFFAAALALDHYAHTVDDQNINSYAD